MGTAPPIREVEYMGFIKNMRESLGIQNKVLIEGESLPYLDMRSGKRYTVEDTRDAYYSNAFRACLLAKSRPLSSLPVDVYQRRDGVREKAQDPVSASLSRLLRHKWNPYLSAAEGIRWTMFTKDTKGNAFIRVQWSDGIPTALYPLSMDPTIEGSAVGPVFDYPGDKFTPKGRYLPHEVVWVKSPVLDKDGFKGVSLARLSARELGLSIDLERFYERLLSNGSHFPGWLETDQKLNEADMSLLKKQLGDHQGIISAGEVRIFPSGLSYHQSPLTMADMSLVDQERWILQQVCRTLSVPPQEVFELSNATYSNIEQGALNFASKTLVPECKALECAFGDILWSAGLEGCYVQFDMNGLLRGDYKSRMEGYRTGIYAGMYSPNEVRALEDMAPYEGGEKLFRPAAYIPVDPETGEELEGCRGSVSQPKPGGFGEHPTTEKEQW